MQVRRRAWWAALALGLGGWLAGCGKTNLVSTGKGSSASAGSAPRSVTPSPRRRARREARAAKLTETPSALQAAVFSRAVNLTLVDLPGAQPSKRSTDRKRTREAAECGGDTKGAVGGGESQRFTRGKGLAREVISSGVVVMASEALAQRDLASILSSEGVACYAKIVRRGLGSEEHGLRLSRLRVEHLHVPLVGSGQQASGLRLSVRITALKSGASLPLFIDALVTLHQSAELELYASSYIQPQPLKTEQQLLELMQHRALLNKL